MMYAVTFCALDGDAGGNPLWHSCILLSQMNEERKQLEAVEHWGFYGVPSSDRSNTWINRIKFSIGLDIDLQGNHGMLIPEDIRFLDLGKGLHGTTFELTASQFELLQQRCHTMSQEQQDAIKEVVDSQAIKGVTSGKIRMYSHEKYSALIYQLEKIKAEQQGRESRLKPFEIVLEWGLGGPSLANSYTCKSQSLALLRAVLTPAQLAGLSEQGKHPTIPRYSGTLESIILHSEGPLSEHKKNSGECVYYRDGSNKEVRLFWTVPPQLVDAQVADNKSLLTISAGYCQEVKSLAATLQSLEWLLRNATVPAIYQTQQQQLIAYIIDTYKAFSVVEPKNTTALATGWSGLPFSLFALPKNVEELTLQKKIKRAQSVLNAIYMAIVDNWRINPDELCEHQPCEAVVSYLSTVKKQTICRILGRTFCADDWLEQIHDADDERTTANLN